MLRLRRLAVASLLCLAVSPSFAAESREKVRTTVLDRCVADEWKVRSVRDKIVDECKCAAAKVSRELTQFQVDAFRDRLPTSPRDYWADASKACFK